MSATVSRASITKRPEEGTMKQLPRRRGHLGTLLVWTALVGLCWQANAQIPRPPLPIPAAPIPILPPISLIPPAVPTPTPPTLATMPISPLIPFPVPLPPPEFDREYTGQLVVTKWNDYSLIRIICKDTPNAVACSYRTYDSVSGKPISCLVMLGPGTWSDERVLQHELGHCNGWPGDHRGARQP
jgi:hypothetical protein